MCIRIKLRERIALLYAFTCSLVRNVSLSIPHTMKRLYHTLAPFAVIYKTHAQIIYVSLHLFLTHSAQTSLLHFVFRQHFAEESEVLLVIHLTDLLYKNEGKNNPTKTMTLINKSGRLSINKLVNKMPVLIRVTEDKLFATAFSFYSRSCFSSYLRFILSAPIPINAASWNDFSFSTNAFRSSSANICCLICLIFSSCSSNCSCATLKRSSSCAFAFLIRAPFVLLA